MSGRQLTLFDVRSASKRRRLNSTEVDEVDSAGIASDNESGSVSSSDSPAEEQEVDRRNPVPTKSNSRFRQCNHVTVQNPRGSTTVRPQQGNFLFLIHLPHTIYATTSTKNTILNVM